MPILRSAKTLDRIATGYWAESAHRGGVGGGGASGSLFSQTGPDRAPQAKLAKVTAVARKHEPTQ